MKFSEVKWVIITYWEEMKRSSTTLNFEGKYRFIQYVAKDCMKHCVENKECVNH